MHIVECWNEYVHIYVGFLCGKCPKQSSENHNETQGLAFNLLQCVTCSAVDAVLFTLICEYRSIPHKVCSNIVHNCF